MTITWIIPDTYGFLVDELEELTTRGVKLRVLTGKPVPNAVRHRLPSVTFYYCPERSLLINSLVNRVFDVLWSTFNWRLTRNGYNAKPIVGIYKVLQTLEKEEESDIIHSHFAYPGGLGGSLIDRPQILTLRGYDILTTGKYGALWSHFFRTNMINSYSKRGIINGGSRFTVNRARQILGSVADIRWIRQGLSATTFTKAGRYTRTILGIKAQDSVLLSIGNLVDVKNHMLLLDVFSKLPAKQRNTTTLLICGDGPLRSALENQSKTLGISKQVKFMGQLKRTELSDIFELSDVFVHTSMSEGFGNVILEAMLFRLLVVASPVGIAPDIIEHKKNGFLPELGDKDSWAKYIEEALIMRSKYTMALEANRTQVLTEFGMDKRIDAYLKIYNEAIDLD